MTGSAADIFVSYKSEHRSRIKRLVDALETDGFSVWWDANIGGGTQDIEQHLETARCVVVVWTSGSIGPEGHFVRDEARRAQRRGAYLPVCLDAVDPPLGFGEIQALPLKSWKGDRSDARFQAIAEAARNHISAEQAVRPAPALREPRVSRRTLIAGGASVGAAILGPLARSEEAVRICDQAIALDPLNARSLRVKSSLLVAGRRYAQAIEAGRKALQITPQHRGAHITIGDALLLLGRIEQAKTEYQAIGPDNPFILSRLGLLAARTGDRAGAEQFVAQFRAQYGAAAS